MLTIKMLRSNLLQTIKRKIWEVILFYTDEGMQEGLLLLFMHGGGGRLK